MRKSTEDWKSKSSPLSDRYAISLPSLSNRNFYARLVALCFLALLVIRALQLALPGMWPHPPESFPLSSMLSHLLVSLGIASFYWSSPWSVLIVLILLASLIFWLRKPQNRLSPLISLFWVVMYFLSLNIFLGHDYHSLVGFILLPLPFLFKKSSRYLLAWDFVRYYFVYIMVSAALWKIFRGTAFSKDHFSEVLFRQNALDWALNPNSLFHQMGIYLFENHALAQALFLVVILLQLSFSAALFTRRYDKILALLFLIFTVFNQLIMGVFSWPLLVFLIPFVARKP